MRYSERITHSSKPGKYFLLLIFFSLISAITAFGQTREEKKMRIQAVKALRAENFSAAKAIYMDLLKLNPDNPDYNYEMGLAIYEEGIHKGQAAPYLEKAILNTKSDTLPDMFLFAGKAEQYSGNFDIAIDYFNTYLKFMDREGFGRDELDEDVERYIQMCENGKVQFENNKKYIRIENLGKSINSVYPDYSPVVTNNEDIILFTSRRDNTFGGGKDFDDKYYEDIYYSLNIEGDYTPASNFDSTSTIINSEVNTEFHDATITYASNETQLFIYRDQHVWVSKLLDGYWTIPVKDQGRINSEKGYEPSVFITQDERTMFVVSDIENGFGLRDIYVTTKGEDDIWKPLENLGESINTPYNEDAPFLTPDGNTLYFASTGHNSIGDYDIFKSILDENGNWLPAENLGPPINTPGHDRYFITSDDGAIGYYASDMDGGYGETDIYRIILDCKAVSATIISGLVYSEDKQMPTAATISIYNPNTNAIIKKYYADSTTGKYEMRLKTETTYGFTIDADGYLPHSGEFMVPQQCEYFNLFQEITIDNLEDSNGQVYAQRASINNAFFDVDQKIEDNFEAMDIASLNLESKDSLRSIIARQYSPIEITNYIQLLDVVDPQGVRLASRVIGDKPVSFIQSRDEMELSYNTQIEIADEQFYSDKLPEARVNYMIASDIKPKEEYPKKQIEIIQNKLVDQPFEANLSSTSEEEKADLTPPTLIESAEPAEEIVVVSDVAPELDEMIGYDNEVSFTDDEVAYAEDQGYTQAQLERMTADQLKRLFAKDINLTYTEETEADNDANTAPPFTDEEIALAEEQGYTQQQLQKMSAEELKRLFANDIALSYTEKTEGVTAVNGMLLVDENDNGLSFTEEEIALAEEEGFTQIQLSKMTAEQLKRLFEKDIQLNYTEEEEAAAAKKTIAQLEEFDNGLAFTDEAIRIALEAGYDQSLLYRMDATKLAEIFAPKSNLNIEEDQPFTKEQYEEILAEFTIAPEEEYTSVVEFTEAEIAYAEEQGYTQEMLAKLGAEALKRLFAKDINLVYNEVVVAETKEEEIEEEPEEPAEFVEVIEEPVEEPIEEPKEEIEVVEKPIETVVFRNILFDFDKSDLRQASISELNKVKNYMNKESRVEVQIDGHADAIGTDKYNMALSERRAQTAHDYLVKQGVGENRVTYQFFGESNPIAPNQNADGSDNPDGRQLNRRCEFKIDESGTADNVVLKY